MRNTFLPLLALSFVVASCGSEVPPVDDGANVEPAREIKQYDYDAFDKNIGYSGGIFSYDEQSIIYSSNETGIRNIYSIPFEGGEPTQLTFSEKETYYLQAGFPNDGRLLFSHDQGGDENTHIYLRAEDGQEIDLTPFEGSKNNFYYWSEDETACYYTSNKRDPRFFDLYKLTLEQIDAGNYEAEMLFENNEGYSIGMLSPDESKLAVMKQESRKNSNIYIVDRSTGDATLVTEHEGDANYSASDFSADGNTLYYSTDQGSDFQYIKKKDLTTGADEVFYQTDWDIATFAFNRSRDFYIILINEDGRNVLKLFDAATNEPVDMPTIEGQNITGMRMSKSQTRLRLYTSSSTSPGTIYSYDKTNDKLTMLRNGLNPEIDERDLVAGKVIRYKSFDGLEIPSNLYLPHGASEENPAPCMLFIHGGPGGQSRLGYNTAVQYMVNHGYAILQVNNRGSSGYGKTFFGLDDLKHGEDDLQDCIEAKKYLASLGSIDMDRVGIMGGSYGGYMTMAALTFAPEEFKVGVNIFGVTNWLRTLRSIPAHWESFREGLYMELGNPNTEDSVRLRQISPLFHTDKITKPLMVLQGANDVRVLQVESDEIVEGAKANGVPVEYVLFPDEGHGFRKKKNEKEAYVKILEFLDKYLVGEEKHSVSEGE